MRKARRKTFVPEVVDSLCVLSRNRDAVVLHLCFPQEPKTDSHPQIKRKNDTKVLKYVEPKAPMVRPFRFVLSLPANPPRAATRPRSDGRDDEPRLRPRRDEQGRSWSFDRYRHRSSLSFPPSEATTNGLRRCASCTFTSSILSPSSSRASSPSSLSTSPRSVPPPSLPPSLTRSAGHPTPHPRQARHWSPQASFRRRGGVHECCCARGGDGGACGRGRGEEGQVGGRGFKAIRTAMFELWVGGGLVLARGGEVLCSICVRGSFCSTRVWTLEAFSLCASLELLRLSAHDCASLGWTFSQQEKRRIPPLSSQTSLACRSLPRIQHSCTTEGGEPARSVSEVDGGASCSLSTRKARPLSDQGTYCPGSSLLEPHIECCEVETTYY